jgi:hypothetical protein
MVHCSENVPTFWEVKQLSQSNLPFLQLQLMRLVTVFPEDFKRKLFGFDPIVDTEKKPSWGALDLIRLKALGSECDSFDRNIGRGLTGCPLNVRHLWTKLLLRNLLRASWCWSAPAYLGARPQTHD